MTKNTDIFYHWLTFYNNIKDKSWPDCYNEYEFQFLPDHVKKEIVEVYNGQKHININSNDVEFFSADFNFNITILDNFDIEYTQEVFSENYDGKVDCNKEFVIAKDFSVLYNDHMYGHGDTHSQFYPKMLTWLYPGRVFKNCLEWCSGPGFIGFRLLSDGIAESVTMMDKYLPSLNACKKTWSQRPDRLTNKTMNIIHGSSVTALDNTLFDLIVGNPPNFDFNIATIGTEHRITQDPGWSIHTDFFSNIKKNLSPDGVILLLKHINGSQPRDHEFYIQQAGLKINRVFQDKSLPKLYYLEVTHQ